MRGCAHTLNRVVASVLVILAAADAKAGHIGFTLVLAFEERLLLAASARLPKLGRQNPTILK